MTTTIGPITNVPTPGDPIRSNWCQTISHYVVDTPGLVTKNGGTMTGALSFSMSTAQMLNLLSTTYGIGVQSNTEYFRSPTNFAWYQGGSHNDGSLNAGGGSEMMRLVSAGLEVGRGLAQARPLAVYGTGSDSYIGFYDSSTRHGFVGMSGAAGYVRLRAEDTSSTVWLEGQGNVVFATGAGYTERARFDNVGNLLVSKTVSNFAAVGGEARGDGRVWSTVDPATTGFNFQANNLAAAAGHTFMQYARSGTAIGSVTQTGTTGVAFNTSSDRRLKNLLGPVPTPIDRVRRLKVWRFEWKDSGARQDGFVADEVAEVVPDAVTGEPDAVDDQGDIVPQQLDQSRLVPLLTAALQEALDRIVALEQRLTVLEAA